MPKGKYSTICCLLRSWFISFKIKPHSSGFLTFLAFCAFGLVPMMSYVGFGYVPWNTISALKGFNPTFAISCVATAATLLLLGAVKVGYGF